jgi:ABC-2 type transport system ATP-binding protein
MSQRLGIAAAILGDPKYLMLDEPANGLDPEGIAWLRQFIKDYADRGNAVLVSSHLLSEMSQMADNVVVIGKGKLIAETSIKALTGGSSQSGVYVRVPNRSTLETVLVKNSIKFELHEKGVLIPGKQTDTVGKLLFKAGLPVLELTNHSASLEEAFLELTAGSTEYQSSSGDAS